MYHFAYHVASHFIALYFILLLYHCVCESNSVGLKINLFIIIIIIIIIIILCPVYKLY